MRTLALGLPALVAAPPVAGPSARVRGRRATITGAAAAAVLWDGRVSRPEGAGLVALYVALVALVWRREREPPLIGELAQTLEDDQDGRVSARPALGLALALGGIGIMAAGGTVAVEGAGRVVVALSATTPRLASPLSRGRPPPNSSPWFGRQPAATSANWRSRPSSGQPPTTPPQYSAPPPYRRWYSCSVDDPRPSARAGGATLAAAYTVFVLLALA